MTPFAPIKNAKGREDIVPFLTSEHSPIRSISNAFGTCTYSNCAMEVDSPSTPRQCKRQTTSTPFAPIKNTKRHDTVSFLSSDHSPIRSISNVFESSAKRMCRSNQDMADAPCTPRQCRRHSTTTPRGVERRMNSPTSPQCYMDRQTLPALPPFPRSLMSDFDDALLPEFDTNELFKTLEELQMPPPLPTLQLSI